MGPALVTITIQILQDIQIAASFKQMNEVPAPGPGLHQHHAAWGDPTGPLMDYNNVNVQDLC